MNLLSNLFYLLAEGEAATGTNTTGSGKSIDNYWLIIVMGVLIVAMVVMTIIPNKRRQKEYQKMQTEIRPGTKIMTIGRMIGTVVRVYDNNTLEVDVGTPGAPVVITINREAIGINLDAQAAQQAAKAAPVADAPAQESVSVSEDEQSEIPQEESALPQEEPKKKKEDDSI